MPILWFDLDPDDNGDQLPTTANLNDNVQPQGDGNLQMCVQNTSSVTVQVSMNLVGSVYTQ